MKMGCCGEHKKHCHCAENAALESKLSEEESTRRDVTIAFNLQDHQHFNTVETLICALEGTYGWNSNHAREIAELAWTELYVEKDFHHD